MKLSFLLSLISVTQEEEEEEEEVGYDQVWWGHQHHHQVYYFTPMYIELTHNCYQTFFCRSLALKSLYNSRHRISMDSKYFLGLIILLQVILGGVDCTSYLENEL